LFIHSFCYGAAKIGKAGQNREPCRNKILGLETSFKTLMERSLPSNLPSEDWFRLSFFNSAQLLLKAIFSVYRNEPFTVKDYFFSGLISLFVYDLAKEIGYCHPCLQLDTFSCSSIIIYRHTGNR
jgi:hypothetical protein